MSRSSFRAFLLASTAVSGTMARWSSLYATQDSIWHDPREQAAADARTPWWIRSPRRTP